MKKKKVVLFSATGAVMAGVGTYLFKEKADRIKITGSHKEVDDNVFPIKKAGQPEPENIPDNKMVSEGAQFGVQYHDQVKK